MFTNYIFHPKNIFFMRCESVIIIKKKKKLNSNNINVNWLLDFIISLSYGLYNFFFISNEKIFHGERKGEIFLLCG